MIIKTGKENYSLFKYMSLVLPTHLEKEISDQLQPPAEILAENKTNIKKSITPEEARAQLVNVKNLTFGVTQNCNLRCGYCAYGGKYKYNRLHNSSSMSMDTYRKAADLFFQLADSPARVQREVPVMAFYGGEPLLEYQNIMKACDYIDNKIRQSPLHKNVRYMITTNGLLLTPDRSGNLLDRGFRIDISLDGPKDQHDKFRVKVDQTGTFDEIMRNISAIKTEHRRKIRFMLTLHPDHDVKRLEEFFLSNPQLFSENNLFISEVSLMNLGSRHRKTWWEKSLRQKQIIDDELDKNQWFYKKLVFSVTDKYFSNPTITLAASANFTGACFPGVDKIFVENDGSIHVCEKIHSAFPIGHVGTGIDYDAILKLKNQWNQQIVKMKCWDCDAWWTCPFCYAIKAKADSIVIGEDGCENYRHSIKKSFTQFIESREKDDQMNHSNCYSSVRDYLEAL
jgi:uncharacterized protein